MVVGICIKNIDDGVVTIKEPKKRKFRTFFVFFKYLLKISFLKSLNK